MAHQGNGVQSKKITRRTIGKGKGSVTPPVEEKGEQKSTTLADINTSAPAGSEIDNSEVMSPQVKITGEEADTEKEGPSTLRRIGTRIGRMFRKSPDDIHIIRRAREIDEEENPILPPGTNLERVLDWGDQFVKVEIHLDPETSEYIYHPVEPRLAPRQKKVMEFLSETLSRALKYNKDAMEDPDKKKSFLESELAIILKDYSTTIGSVTEDFLDPIFYYIRREFLGYGKINPIMSDVGVEDISCDGTDIPVFVFHRDYGSMKTSVVFETDEELEGFIVALAQKAGKSITVADPILDSTLPEGHRLNATYGREITTRGSSFTIRKFKEDPLTITDLVTFGTLSPEMAAHLWMAVQYGESMIFAGGTASGKTATMNAISIFIPTSAKIISIEDTREVNLPHQNWIAGITRGGAEGEKASDVNMYDLLRAALRQRPEYVLVGEVRGKETMTMFQAMSTGHTTYSTMHADSVKSIVYRLENPPISIPRVLIQSLNLVAIHNQLRVKGKRVRRITELVEIVGIEPTSLEVITNKVYQWEPAGDSFSFGGHSHLYEKIMDMEDMSRDMVLMELSRRSESIDWMVRNRVRQFKDVSKLVVEYYEDPEKVMKLLRENPEIDISKDFDLFEGEFKERLPPVEMEALPKANGSRDKKGGA